ncbi:GSCFA domain-containing protein [Flammeovirga kamogawensis]|uniref:GSCFA domain-containing protein n=1 Tax=Flammeovirga kamogawensis TaxID=373891 RepID=A0ABX8GX56_9BACT|nr:GSCFA domain-containing protein [Flammeovirga kamogawensis]MBB6460834.1 lysophospholipase L1-like esterase [Flammeovirga kamogawensis]QWG08185.1 GSCFA domain-containing protein [Flammeovirga kamogawensis]TRX69988.1 GSCFA domain-containing protein [Flammeovirga kamogawensis]
MMHNETFRTSLEPVFFENKINYSSKLFSIGSCFSQNIGNRLSDYQFNIVTNPYGTLYNPVSIFNNLINSLTNNPINEGKIVTINSVYKHFDFHSDISSNSKQNLLSEIKMINKEVKTHLSKCTHLFITLGTSFIFEKITDSYLVGNCHKVPTKEFNQRLLDLEEMTSSFDELYQLLPKNISIVFTVSPIRHFRNGLVDNNLSKSILRYFTHQVCNKYTNVDYFPSFEIMMDDLRDYRFYTEDMVHPSPLAIDYIWSYFKNGMIDIKTEDTLKKIDKIRKGIAHRPFNPRTEAHQKFLNKLKQITLSIKDFNTETIILKIDELIIKSQQ